MTGIGMNELAAGNLDAAQPLLEEAAARFPNTPSTMICSAYLAAAKGDNEGGRSVERDCVARFPYYSKANRAALAAMLHDRDAAIALLTAAHAERDMNLLQAAFHPAFDWLADDAQFRSLLERCGIGGRSAAGAWPANAVQA
jgi:hypothetical protein